MNGFSFLHLVQIFTFIYSICLFQNKDNFRVRMQQTAWNLFSSFLVHTFKVKVTFKLTLIWLKKYWLGRLMTCHSLVCYNQRAKNSQLKILWRTRSSSCQAKNYSVLISYLLFDHFVCHLTTSPTFLHDKRLFIFIKSFSSLYLILRLQR